MREQIAKQREMLAKLNSEIMIIKNFLIGQQPEEVNDTRKEECLMDLIYNNNSDIDYAIKQIDELKRTMIGE